ncbi:MAG: porin family protein [Prevotellaceae bacterium]|nr:porin family protein [Prevotellaceae bacterium]
MKKTIFLLGMALLALPAIAQTDRDNSLINASKKGWDFEVRAGLNIGGATPVPFPREIREVKSYNPKLNGAIAGIATYWFGDDGKRSPWGLSTGLKLEEKRMSTKARVKNYHTTVVDEGNYMTGYWTGNVKTNYSSTLFTIPVDVNYRFNDRWRVWAGLYASFQVDGSFDGEVHDGYLRNLTPTGEKAEFKDGKNATYDFSDDLRKFQWGLEIGGSWRAYKHFNVNANLAYGPENIFHSDFNTISFRLHQIAFNIGFGYLF